MYHNRIKEMPVEHGVFYMITNRITGGSFLLHDLEKQQMHDLLIDGQKRFCYKVWDYVIMDNHYHALIECLPFTSISDEKLLRRYRFYKKDAKAEFTSEMAKEEFRNKAHDISFIVGNFQQRFTQWFNKKYQRWGVLFGSRFDSEIVESNKSLLRVMAYITLNPVRAEIVVDPKDYHFCGYTEREAGTGFGSDDHRLFCNLLWTWGLSTENLSLSDKEKRKIFNQTFRAYLLKKKLRKIDVYTVEKLADRLGRFDMSTQLVWRDEFMHRCSYFSKCIAIGSEAFIAEKIQRFRELMHWKREHRPCTENGWDHIYVLKKRRRPACG